MGAAQLNVLRAFVVSESGSSGNGGNPAGVVLNSEHLNKSQRQKIALTAGFSETAFVSKSTRADFKIDFFTPNKQIARCGHATVATFEFMRSKKLIAPKQFTFEASDGIASVLVESDKTFLIQEAPIFTELDSREVETIFDSIQLQQKDALPEFTPIIVSTGVPFVLIGVKNRTVLTKIVPMFPEIKELSEHFDIVGFYLFTKEVISPSSGKIAHLASTRMFAPAYGIREESATGMGAGALGALLAGKLGVKDKEFIVEQGYQMKPPSPSELTVRVAGQGDSVTSVSVGGRAELMETRELQL